MTPGPKKKGFSQKAEDDKPNYRRRDNSQRQSGKPSNQKYASEKAASNNFIPEKLKNSEETRIESNWDRYKEPDEDVHADIPRGEDFEVLLSYSSGAGSQLQLQEEREWNDYKFAAKDLSLDMKRLNNMLKCIPFHKRLGIPSSIFSSDQIQNFERCAESSMKLLESDDGKLDSVVNDKESLTSWQPQSIEKKGEYIIEEDANECVGDEQDYSTPSVGVKTENLIESLSSCLSTKAVIQSSEVKIPDTKACHVTDADDLSYLLSLTSPAKASDEPKSEDVTKLTKSNVDEWLSSILDD